jgi:hypothetical protein
MRVESVEVLTTLCDICKANEAEMASKDDCTDGRMMFRLGKCQNQMHTEIMEKTYKAFSLRASAAYTVITSEPS